MDKANRSNKSNRANRSNRANKPDRGQRSLEFFEAIGPIWLIRPIGLILYQAYLTY